VLTLWDLASGACIAKWYSEGWVTAIDVASPQTFVIGDATGVVTLLGLVEEEEK
jgi:hypothetical protein